MAPETTPRAVADSLPPTEYLMLEVLAARHRLGEPCWTFPSRLRHVAKSLAGRGLAWWESAPTPYHIEVTLSEEGRAGALSGSYVPPVAKRPEPDDLAARLGSAIADLDAHIERRARELAGPMADAATRHHAAEMAILEERRASERDRAVWAEHLAAELRDLADALKRQLDRAKAESRQNAKIAAAALDRQAADGT